MSSDRHHAEFEVQDTAVLMSLTGPNGRILQELSKCARADVDFRGNKILLSGDRTNVELARRAGERLATEVIEGATNIPLERLRGSLLIGQSTR